MTAYRLFDNLDVHDHAALDEYRSRIEPVRSDSEATSPWWADHGRSSRVTGNRRSPWTSSRIMQRARRASSLRALGLVTGQPEATKRWYGVMVSKPIWA
jgi:hypothetical protein